MLRYIEFIILQALPDVATVTSKSMVNIPAKIRREYGLEAGSKVLFIDSDGQITLVPLPTASSLFGIDRKQKVAILQGLRELEKEHRREATE
jgi:AbrB family looped-hinge helix DNA binding protein